jgi:hypothetical protein
MRGDEKTSSYHFTITITDGNYLELEHLQRGVVWAVGRLGRVRPERVAGTIEYVLPYLDKQDAILGGPCAPCSPFPTLPYHLSCKGMLTIKEKSAYITKAVSIRLPWIVLQKISNQQGRITLVNISDSDLRVRAKGLIP